MARREFKSVAVFKRGAKEPFQRCTSLIAQCALWPLWLRPVEHLTSVCSRQVCLQRRSNTLPYVTNSHCYYKKGVLQSGWASSIVVFKKGGSLQKEDPDIVRRQTDERHKAMLGIFTAVSKLKWEGFFVVVKAYILIHNKYHIWLEKCNLVLGGFSLGYSDWNLGLIARCCQTYTAKGTIYKPMCV